MWSSAMMEKVEAVDSITEPCSIATSRGLRPPATKNNEPVRSKSICCGRLGRIRGCWRQQNFSPSRTVREAEISGRRIESLEDSASAGMGEEDASSSMRPTQRRTRLRQEGAPERGRPGGPNEAASTVAHETCIHAQIGQSTTDEIKDWKW